MDLSVRIQKAFEADPLLDLARELFKEGYSEDSFMCDVKKERENGKVIDDVAFIRIRNNLRDLRLGIKK